MRKITVIGLLLCLFSFVTGEGYAQEHAIDSLKDKLTQNLADKEKSHIANQLSILYLHKEDFDMGLQYAYISLEFALRSGNPKAISNAYVSIGNSYSYVNLFNTALEYYLKSLKELKDTLLVNNLARIYLFMGQIYNKLHRYDSARICLNFANKYLSRSNKPQIKNIILTYYGEVEQNTGNYDKAKDFYQEALSLYQTSKDTVNMINTLRYITDLYDVMQDFEKERILLKKSIMLATLSKQPLNVCQSTLTLARCYINKGDLAKAYPLLLKGDTCLSRINDMEINKSLFLTYSKYFEKKNDLEKAYNYYNKYLQVDDSLQNRYFHLVKNLFDIRYNTESKIKELNLLTNNDQIQSLKYQKNIFYKDISEGIFFFFLTILIVLIIIYLQKQHAKRKLLETNKKLEQVNKELEKRKEKQQYENQIRNKLFMILAHDLINPFNALLGFAELLSEEIHEFDRKDIKRHSEFIYQSARQLHFLLENLLQWARIQTGRIKFVPSYIEADKIIRDVIDTYHYVAEKKGITITVDSDENLIVYADENMLADILRNLVHNAIKFTDKEGTINIKGVRENGKVTLWVCDNGSGISEEELDKLFNLEYHFTRKGTSGEQGTGLGLIICKELLDQHHSKLNVQSHPGKGSCFSFSLSQKKENI